MRIIFLLQTRVDCIQSWMQNCKILHYFCIQIGLFIQSKLACFQDIREGAKQDGGWRTITFSMDLERNMKMDMKTFWLFSSAAQLQ